MVALKTNAEIDAMAAAGGGYRRAREARPNHR
jgi:hypothetical protein